MYWYWFAVNVPLHPSYPDKCSEDIIAIDFDYERHTQTTGTGEWLAIGLSSVSSI